jgi:plastocyanin
MNRRSFLTLLAVCFLLAAIVHRGRTDATTTQAAAAGGTIEGQVHLIGQPPGNVVIRMGVDPRCAQMNRGTRVVQETVVTNSDGALANVFVHLIGSFPRTPPPTEPVTIDQRRCIYSPRVVGARVGQTVEFRNSDETLHNVHSFSTAANDFNAGQPLKGMTYTFHLKREEVVLHVKCDIHRWMNTYIGVLDHPYFAVSSPGGTFTIPGVPAGSYTIEAWHERYGRLPASVIVKTGETAKIEFRYSGTERPGTPGDLAVRDVLLPAGLVSARLVRPARPN